MVDFKMKATVVGLNPDFDQISGERYTQINLGIETVAKVPPEQQSNAFSVPRVRGWKFILNVFIPSEKWNNQYQMWQQYDITIKENGEMELKLQE